MAGLYTGINIKNFCIEDKVSVTVEAFSKGNISRVYTQEIEISHSFFYVNNWMVPNITKKVIDSF